jgi:hypothetical protein
MPPLFSQITQQVYVVGYHEYQFLASATYGVSDYFVYWLLC